jgi:hypothetical protein
MTPIASTPGAPLTGVGPELRTLRAWRLRQEGATFRRIAAELGVAPMTARRIVLKASIESGVPESSRQGRRDDPGAPRSRAASSLRLSLWAEAVSLRQGYVCACGGAIEVSRRHLLNLETGERACLACHAS